MIKDDLQRILMSLPLEPQARVWVLEGVWPQIERALVEARGDGYSAGYSDGCEFTARRGK